MDWRSVLIGRKELQNLIGETLWKTLLIRGCERQLQAWSQKEGCENSRRVEWNDFLLSKLEKNKCRIIFGNVWYVKYHINTDKCTDILLNHHFINTIHNTNMFYSLKGHLQGLYLIHSNKVDQQNESTCISLT